MTLFRRKGFVVYITLMSLTVVAVLAVVSLADHRPKLRLAQHDTVSRVTW